MSDSKIYKLKSVLTDQDIELLLENQRQNDIIRQQHTENIITETSYNRKTINKPNCRIGNWVEETALHQNNEQHGTSNPVIDHRVDTTQHYTTYNREYGVKPEEKDITKNSTLLSDEFKNRPGRKLNEAEPLPKLLHDHHDILNKTLENKKDELASTTHSTFVPHQKGFDGTRDMDFSYQVKVHEITLKKQ